MSFCEPEKKIIEPFEEPAEYRLLENHYFYLEVGFFLLPPMISNMPTYKISTQHKTHGNLTKEGSHFQGACKLHVNSHS